MINEILDSEIKPIIAWGAGYYYNALKRFINNLGVEYIYDIKWENNTSTTFDGKKIIRPSEIKKLEKCIIIICICDKQVAEDLKEELSNQFKNANIYLLRNLSPVGRKINCKEILLNSNDGKYVDHCGNTIIFSTEKSLEKMEIRFNGNDALISIGEDVRVVNSLYIECGNETEVIIGKKTSFDKTTIYSAYANINIGEDCMFSYDIYLRNHDSHFIFDKNSGKRINYGKSIVVGDHVWVGQNCILLGGFKIGDGSVVGAGSVSSSQFSNNLIVAGNSARVIRNDVIWDRKMTWVYNYDSIDELKKESE